LQISALLEPTLHRWAQLKLLIAKSVRPVPSVNKKESQSLSKISLLESKLTTVKAVFTALLEQRLQTRTRASTTAQSGTGAQQPTLLILTSTQALLTLVNS